TASRSAAASARLYLGAFSAIVRILHRGRLGSHTLQWSAVPALWTDRADVRGRALRSTYRHVAYSHTASIKRRTRPPRNRAWLGRSLRRTHRSRGACHAIAGTRELSCPVPARLGPRRSRRARTGAMQAAAFHAASE